MDRPEPQACEVLVRVHAAGVSPGDLKIRGAGQRMGMTLPIYLDGKIAGFIEKLGDSVSGLKEGDAIYGIVGSNCFAKYIVAPAADMARKPASVGDLELD